MGFYAPAQIVRDAQDHGVEMRSVCVNASRWDTSLEPAGKKRFAVRLDLRMVRGLSNADAARLVAVRSETPYASLEDVWRRGGFAPATLAHLAEADAFRSAFGLARRCGRSRDCATRRCRCSRLSATARPRWLSLRSRCAPCRRAARSCMTIAISSARLQIVPEAASFRINFSSARSDTTLRRRRSPSRDLSGV